MSIVQITDQKSMQTVHLFTHSPTHDLKIPNVYSTSGSNGVGGRKEREPMVHRRQSVTDPLPVAFCSCAGRETRRTHRGEEHAWKSHRAECACSEAAFPLDRSMFCVLCFV